MKYKFNRSLFSGYSSYIVNSRADVRDSGAVIPLLFSPNSLSESLSASYDQQNIPGHSRPIITFSYTGARQVSLSFDIPADHIPSGFTMGSYINALKNLETPSYSGNIVYPPSCSLHLPNLDLRGVCSNVSIEYKTDRIMRNGTTGITVSLTFIETQDAYAGWTDISFDDSNTSEGDYSSTSGNNVTKDENNGNTKLTLNTYGLEQSTPIEVVYNENYSMGNASNNYGHRDLGKIMGDFTSYNAGYIRMKMSCLKCGKSLLDNKNNPYILEATKSNDETILHEFIDKHIKQNHPLESVKARVYYEAFKDKSLADILLNVEDSENKTSSGSRYVNFSYKKSNQ